MIYEVSGKKFRLPKWAKARVAEEDDSILKILDINENFHVAIPLEQAKEGGAIRAALTNLGAAIFEQEHPGCYSKLFVEKARAEYYGGEMQTPWRNLWARLQELTP